MKRKQEDVWRTDGGKLLFERWLNGKFLISNEVLSAEELRELRSAIDDALADTEEAHD